MKKVKKGAETLLYPMPAVLAGTMVNGKPTFMTAAWCGIVASTPPAISVGVRPARFTFEGIAANGTFSVNVPSADLAEMTKSAENQQVHLSAFHEPDSPAPEDATLEKIVEPKQPLLSLIVLHHQEDRAEGTSFLHQGTNQYLQVKEKVLFRFDLPLPFFHHVPRERQRNVSENRRPLGSGQQLPQGVPRLSKDHQHHLPKARDC